MNESIDTLSQLPTTDRMPAYFLGHGNPMNALADNAFTRSLAALGSSFHHPPNAILVVSAHWLTRGTRIAVTEIPETIHDFTGFPPELYRVRYPAPGAPVVAREALALLTQFAAAEDSRWGLDHGAWSVLRHMFPDASVPVFQMSIDAHREPRYHYELAKQLTPLRSHGVVIIGSGNIVHNLSQVDLSNGAAAAPWAIEFDEDVRKSLTRRDDESLIDYERFGAAARLSVPTNDHYLPLLFTLGAAAKDEDVQFTFEGIEHSSLSMRCIKIG
ncbi:MAG: 4,5-DOPA dioxygenase extradiol [Ignavibacteriales bacterium]|nr:4,5-DOPA dioxygenase extradiol [Ignavibacteriales bacterium]